MNPLIDKLKTQSLIVDSSCSDMPIVSFSQDRFAQLIIKECATFLRDVMNDPIAAKKLEEHFDID